MNTTIVGTCSLCGGPVVIPKHWLSVVPPIPTCKKCGATPRRNYGPVIDMDPDTKGWYEKTWTLILNK